MNKLFGKNDIILLLILLAVAVAGIYFFYFRRAEQGNQVQIMVDGEVFGTYSQTDEQEIKIPNASGITTNILSIKDGKAKMIDADCPDKLCEYQNAISQSGETIVCLPNKVIVIVAGDDEDEFDAFSK